MEQVHVDFPAQNGIHERLRVGLIFLVDIQAEPETERTSEGDVEMVDEA